MSAPARETEAEKAGWTPGPHVVQRQGSQTFLQACDFQIALMCDGSDKQIAANANLYAAAPEMYEALMAARGWLSGWASAEREIAQIDAALLNATGALS